jgi:hypothetical protein
MATMQEQNRRALANDAAFNLPKLRFYLLGIHVSRLKT